MSTYLGIGLGPIQTGTFALGAENSPHIDRIVFAETNPVIVEAVRRHGKLHVNVADSRSIHVQTVNNVEIYNPAESGDFAKLVQLASEADEIVTALPSVAIYPAIAPLLKEAFLLNPEYGHIVYTAENNNTAAEQLESLVGTFKNTVFINTVIGKMSKVCAVSEASDLHRLSAELDLVHLVEAFNDIFISPIKSKLRGLDFLIEKKNLLPFEEAKLYGHNAIHSVVGYLAREKNIANISDVQRLCPDIMKVARNAFILEAGLGICRKWSGSDALFNTNQFEQYVDDLLERMVNPFLADTAERVCRDPERKLAWDDRLIGAMRLCLYYKGKPEYLGMATFAAAAGCFGTKCPAGIKTQLKKLWPEKISQDEAHRVFAFIKPTDFSFLG